jgi:hypothetical protein
MSKFGVQVSRKERQISSLQGGYGFGTDIEASVKLCRHLAIKTKNLFCEKGTTTTQSRNPFHFVVQNLSSGCSGFLKNSVKWPLGTWKGSGMRNM